MLDKNKNPKILEIIPRMSGTIYTHLHKKIEKSKLFQQKLDFLLKKEIILDKKIHKVEIRKN